MKNKLYVMFFLLASLLSSCENTSKEIQSLAQLSNGKTFAVPTGTVADQFVLKRFPDAKIAYYNSVYDCALAVTAGKVDAAVYDKPVLKNIAAKNGGMKVLDEILVPDQYGFAVSMDNHELKKEIDKTLDHLRQSGVYDEMQLRWFPEQGAPLPMPNIELNGTAGILIFGTAATTEPMSFVDGNQRIVGFDIEFAERIAAQLNKKLEIVNMEFGAMLPALLAGKVDMIGAGLSITEERAKSVLFSESYYESGLAALVETASNSSQSNEKQIDKKSDDWTNIGVLMGTIHELYAKNKYPKAQIKSFNTLSDMLMALSTNKVEAAFVDQSSVKEIFAANPHFKVLKKNIFQMEIGAGFNPESDALPQEFNQLLKEMKLDGTYEAMVKRWHENTNSQMPEIEYPNLTGVIRIGTMSDIGLPFVTKNNGKFEGFDVEMGSRFAARLGKKPEWIDMPFGSLMPSLVSGKIDMIISSMTITEERRKKIVFSDPYYEAGVSIIGMKTERPSSGNQKMAVLDDIADKKVAIFTGTVHDAFVGKKFPKANVFRFESTADMMISLKSGKVDVAMFDRITANLVMKRNPELGLLSDQVFDTPLGVGVNKNNKPLLNEFNEFLSEIKADGTYNEMFIRWFEEDAEEAVMPEFSNNQHGKPLLVGVSVEDLPYVAFMNNQYVGFDIEMMHTFAQRRNYNLKLVTIDFPALVAALSSGKVDMITDGISISEERARQIDFSDPYATFRTSVIALKKNLAAYEGYETPSVKEPFLTRLKNSFYNNIVLEKRYLLIIRGLLVTILISIFAAIAGTLLGGLVCYMRMSPNMILTKIASYYIALIRGTPVLVLLMIIYYVVFASVNINAVLVAIIAFGINFAAYVSEMFRTSIENVDKGQHEAGIASGFTKVQTFIHIIMPQAIRQVLPVYKGEFISLLKMTSVVGYIAVEDLTKASDIIRSRTFDAFFPLIMAAVIYIVIAYLLTLALDRVEINVDPKKRRNRIRKEATL
jgi:polar amino acid transport system substrate-binding protein